MAHNPTAPQGPEGNGSYDPAGSTQMFRAFVDEGTPQRQQEAATTYSSGPRVGLIVGVVAAIAVVAAVAWLALS
ncbi:hypothetical protein I3F58_20700 [Streptomyces sp. MUM 203J]|uniref:hypothetical protein n=1 Tax=Streptomyces sp. MUM 203J TaxID=2791990 RepID=UPI001F039A23|nr:hypothetical protein [Streptomyces sp. MUM 203J]MCH0541943.1 hypothetical protein [Streptomyces sp. MUM 203J]